VGVVRVVTEGGAEAEEAKVQGGRTGTGMEPESTGRLSALSYRQDAWRNKIDDTVGPEYRRYGRYVETGRHVTLVCTHGEGIGRS